MDCCWQTTRIPPGIHRLRTILMFYTTLSCREKVEVVLLLVGGTITERRAFTWCLEVSFEFDSVEVVKVEIAMSAGGWTGLAVGGRGLGREEGEGERWERRSDKRETHTERQRHALTSHRAPGLSRPPSGRASARFQLAQLFKLETRPGVRVRFCR